MKKKFIVLISIISTILLAGGIFAFAYFGYFYKLKGSEIVMENVKFTVNDNPNKSEENSIYLTNEELTKTDGYQIVLNYSLNGSFVSNYAMQYKTYFQIEETNSSIATALDLYRFDNGVYKYRGKLSELASTIEGEKTEVLYQDYLGPMGTHKEKFLIIYPMGSIINGNVNLKLKISTTSNIALTDSNQFPYYYLNDIGVSDDGSSSGRKAENVFEAISKDTEDAAVAKDRTVVLMKDIIYASKTDLEFDNTIGLDLNGYTLDLKGGSLTFKDTSDVASGKTINHPNVKFTDSKGSGMLKGSVVLNYQNTLVDIEDSFIDAVNRGSSTLTITNASLAAYKKILDENLENISKLKHLTTNGNYSFDAFGYLRNYSSLITVALESSTQQNTATVTFNADKTVTISGVDTNEIINLNFKLTKGANTTNTSINLELYGSSVFDCSEYLKSYIPRVLDGSIYLPSYIESFNSFVTWISDDEEVLSSTGELLPNGYKNLDNWYNNKVDLGFIIAQNDKVINGIIKDIEVIILTEEERTNLIFSESNVVFASETADTNEYSFRFIDLLAERYGAYRANTEPEYATEPINLSKIAQEFNVILDSEASYQNRITYLLSEISRKLGLANIPYTVEVTQGSTIVTETKENDSVVNVEQNSIPSNLVVITYDVTFKFNNGTANTVEVLKNKIISVNAATQVVSFVDLTNTLRVPFDTYTKYMTEYSVDENGYYTYNPYINTFELVDSFNNTAIEYTVPDEYKDYVSIRIVNGRTLLEVAKDNVPADTHTVTVTAKVEGFDDNLYLPFTCVGVLHNASSVNHAEFEDGKLYIELLNLYDINQDQVLTDLEAKNSPITNLQIREKNIISLIGLRYFENLTSVDFSGNNIVNIDDLAYLKNVTTINLNNNKAASLEPLRYLDNLRDLFLSNNQLSTIEPIQYLTKLKKLWVTGNVITDFQYVQNLTSLTELGVSNNKNSSGQLSVWLSNDSQGMGNFSYVIRGNQYYFNLLAQKRGTSSFKLVENNDAKTAETIIDDAKKEALYLSMIEPVYKTSDTVVLPTVFTAPDGETYEITYNVTDDYSNFINFEKVETGADAGKITNVTLRQLPIDKEVTIYADIIGLAENFDHFYRPLKLVIRKGASDSRLFGAIEVKPNYWVKGEELVKDSNLLSILWANYDSDNDGMITNTELKHASSTVSLNLEDKRITSLSGIEYFGNIKYINLRNNDLELNDIASGRDPNAANISYLAYLTTLTDLYLNRQYFDFDDLLNYTRLKDGSSYADYRSETRTITNAILVDSTHSADDETNLFDKTITVDFDHVGLTSLKLLNTNGCQRLSDYDVKTKLYHVFLTNKSTEIHKDSAGIKWVPIEDELNKILGSMTTSAKFINYNDKVEIEKTYSFYLYDDLYPTTFSLSFTALNERQYLYSAVTNENYGPTTNNTYKNIYLADGTLYELSDIDSSFIDKNNHRLNSYFDISTDTEHINIQYKRLTYRDYQAYLEMKLSVSSLSNSRRSYSTSSTFFMTLFMQYNNDYVFKDAVDDTNPDNGKPVNVIFGSTESVLYVMNGLSDSLRKNERNYYYVVTKSDGTPEKYYYDHTNSTSYLEGETGYIIDDTLSYEVLTTDVEGYDGSFNESGAYDPNTYFFIAGNFMPTASSSVDGLRYLPQITKVYFKNDAVLGTGKDLINLTELFICYSYFDIKDFNTVLPNMKYLTISQSSATNLSRERNTQSDPNDLFETYMVYFPNLIQFHFSGEGTEEKGQMYEWSAFLAYSYIPYYQIYKKDSNGKNIYYHMEHTLEGDKEYVGGMELDSDQLYYWYDKTVDDEHPYTNFKQLYYYSNTAGTYSPLDESNLDTTTSGGVYTNIFTDQYGTHLDASLQIFRHVKKGTVKLNNFKLSRGSSLYDSGTNKYSNTYENQLVLMEIFKNLESDSVKTHYYIATEPHVDDGDSYDFDPHFEDINFATTLTDEYNEIAPTVADFHVRLYGYKFDGTNLWEDGIGTEYSTISWTDTDYSDYFRQGLLVRLPLTFDDFKTGNTDYDKKYRTFTISWYASYAALSGSSYIVRYETSRIGYATFDGNSISCHSENMPSQIFRKYRSGNTDYVYDGKCLLFYLDVPGYYIFEGVLELSGLDDNGNIVTYTYNTTYDPRAASLKGDSQYNYTNEVSGSVSVIYPITISSLPENYINLSNVSSRVKSMSKVYNYASGVAYLNNRLNWWDTIIDRSFKFVVFSNFAKTGIQQNDESYVLSIGTNTSNANPYDSDNNSRLRLFDKILYSSYELKPQDSSYDSNFTSTNIDNGIDTRGKSQFAVKTYAGLKRFISDIYTLEGWDKLKISEFYYKYASNLTYLPTRFPTTLTKLIVTSTYGITYYGGLFNSNVQDARMSYYTTDTTDAGVDMSSYANYNYQTDNMLDIYDYPDLITKINSASSITIPLTTLAINSISEESFKVLGELSNKLTNKLTIYLKTGKSDNFMYTFNDYNMIKHFCDTVNRDKLEIIIDSGYSGSSFTGTSLITILKTLVLDYAKVTGTNSLTTSHWYETTEGLSSKVSVQAFDNSSSAIYWNHPGDNAVNNVDFYPNLTIFKDIQYNVAIRYTISGNKRVQLLKPLSSNQSTGDTEDRYTYEIAVFNSGIKTGTSISYSTSDLTFYDTSNFDSEFVKFLINMTRATGGNDRYTNEVTINGNKIVAVRGPQLFRKYNFKTKSYEDYKEKEDNSTDPSLIDGYVYILDTKIKINEKKYVLIINTEIYNLNIWVDANVGGVQTQSYSTLDLKGFELLPFKAIIQGNGIHTKGSTMYVTKITNSGTIASGVTPKIQYIEINNKAYEEVLGINQSGSETYNSMFTTITNVDNLAKSLANGATLVLGDRCKILQRFLKYDSTNGITLINDQSKTIFVKLDYAKMHLLFNNYASTYTGSAFNYDNAYDTSFNYSILKQEILNATMGEETIFFKDYHDYYSPINAKLLNFAGGELTNITLYNNLMNHPFYSEYRGVLSDDSCYNYYISYNDGKNAKILYSGTAYDPNKVFGAILNVHSNNIRKLSNNKNISMYFESDQIEEIDNENTYIVSDSVKLKLPKTLNGTKVVYLPIDTFFVTSELKYWNPIKFKNPLMYNKWVYFDQNYGFSVPKNTYNYSAFDIWVIKEYNDYFEISLTANHQNYTGMRYTFAAFEYNGNQYSGSGGDDDCLALSLTDWFKDKTVYANAANYDYAFNVDKGETYIKAKFYVDVNANPAIGRQVIKEDDPMYLPTVLTIVGTDYKLSYTVDPAYASYLNFEKVEVEIDPVLHSKQYFYKVQLTDDAMNAKDIKITVNVDGVYYTYTTGPTIGGENQTYFSSGETYAATDGENWYGPITDSNTFYYYYDRGYIIRIYNEEGKIAEPHDYVYTSFNFFVDVAANNNAAVNTNYPVQNSDFYVEVLVDPDGKVVPGSLVSKYENETGYSYEIRRADTIFESGLLVTDMFYSGGISLGEEDYVRHDFVTSGLNVAYFPKYAVVDSSRSGVSSGDYRSIFVDNGSGSLITYDRNDSDSANAKLSENSNYRLTLLFTKEQIANIHYFSSTEINNSNNVDFRAQSSLVGIEIFPLTNIRLGFQKDYGHVYNNSSLNSRAFSGNIFEPLKDMKLESFELVFKYTTIYINDWTFLFNSRDTLTTFIYGGINTGQGETYGTTHDDFSFLLSFDNLENVRIYGFTGIEKTQNFKYLASSLYLKYGKNIVTYYYNDNNEVKVNGKSDIVKTTSADVAVAIPILYKFHSTESAMDGDLFIDSDFTYKNNYELYLGDETSIYSGVRNYDSSDITTQYLLPSFINDSGTYYKLTYDSLSTFMDVVAVNVETGDEYTMLQYQKLYEEYVFDKLSLGKTVNDYDFASLYHIYARFNDLKNCLTDRIMVSAKIECNSKIASKDEIIAIDNSSINAKTNYINGVGYPDIYYDGSSYIYIPYTYERYLSIYIDHESY